MNSVETRTDEEIEICRLFDRIRSLGALKKELADKKIKEIIEIKGEEYPADAIADSMLAFDLRDFKKLVDGSDPFYADFISEIEQLPGMAKTMKSLDQYEASVAS
ncbi:MAG: hypothetical protein IID57_06850 [Proteobacteria bacterium]|nr:hypothetical protein [Pseudomonadota bacterium]